MDGGGEGVTPVSNIPQHCSGGDHRNLSKQETKRAEQREGTAATLDGNQRGKLSANNLRGTSTKDREKHEKEKPLSSVSFIINAYSANNTERVSPLSRAERLL